MYKIWILALAIVLTAISGYCAPEAQRPDEIGGIVAGVESISAIVTAIDQDTRTVTLKGSDGKEVEVVCGPEVRNFAQIRKGDKVKADTVESVKILVSGVSYTPQREDTLEVMRAPLGKKPAGIITVTSRALATVEAIDYDKRIVTLKGPVRTLNVQVDADAAPNFDMIKTGDTVYIEIYSSTAIAVTK